MINFTSITAEDYTVLSETFKLLGDPTRLRILYFCMDSPKAVGDISSELDLSQSLVSHHLRLLRAARLVKGERHSKNVFYELSDSHVRDVLADLAHHVAEERTEE